MCVKNIYIYICEHLSENDISFSDPKLPISLLLSKALLMLKALSDITFAIKSAFDSKSAFRYHFWMKKCKVGAFGMGQFRAA